MAWDRSHEMYTNMLCLVAPHRVVLLAAICVFLHGLLGVEYVPFLLRVCLYFHRCIFNSEFSLCCKTRPKNNVGRWNLSLALQVLICAYQFIPFNVCFFLF